MSQASPQLGGGLDLLDTLRASSLLGMGWGVAALFTGPVKGPPGSTLHSPWMGVGKSHVLSPSPCLGVPSTAAGQSLGTGETLGTKGASHVPPLATVMTSVPSAMTDQSPVKAEAQPSPQ